MPYSNQIDETLTAKDIPNEKDFYIKLRLNIKILINAIKDTHENTDYLPKAFGDKSFSLAVDSCIQKKFQELWKIDIDLPFRIQKIVIWFF